MDKFSSVEEVLAEVSSVAGRLENGAAFEAADDRWLIELLMDSGFGCEVSVDAYGYRKLTVIYGRTTILQLHEQQITRLRGLQPGSQEAYAWFNAFERPERHAELAALTKPWSQSEQHIC